MNTDTCNCSECQNVASKPRDVNLDVDMNLSLAHGHNKSCEHAQSASPVWKEMDSSIGAPSTLPRMRTRIKTNPWLPSPGATPTLGPTGSYMLSSTVSVHVCAKLTNVFRCQTCKSGIKYNTTQNKCQYFITQCSWCSVIALKAIPADA